MTTSAEQKISSLKHFTPEAKDKVRMLQSFFEDDTFLECLLKSLGEYCWEFHPNYAPGKNRPDDLSDEILKHDLGKSFFNKIFKIHLQPYDHNVMWINGKTPILLDRFLDDEIKGWKEFVKEVGQ